MKYRMEEALECIIDYRGKTPQKSEAGIPTLSAKSVKNGYIDYSECYFISEDEYARFMVRGIPQIGDILLTTEAPMGMVARLDRDDVGIAQRLLTLRGKQGILDNNYLMYYLQSPIGQGKLREKETGSTVTGIKQSEFRKIEIDIPEISHQIKLSSFLYCIDKKIECNKAINRNLFQQAQTLFRHFLTNASGTTLPISTIADINPENYSPKDEWKYINYLDTSSITEGTITDIQFVDPSTMKLPSRARRILRKGDVVFSTVRPNQLHYGIITDPLPNMLGSTGFAVIRSKKETIPNELIYLALTDPMFIEQMQQMAEQSVSTFPSIKATDLDACTIPDPVAGDQGIIDGIKASIDVIGTNNKENKELSALRDYLLPKLMSGELEVSDIDL